MRAEILAAIVPVLSDAGRLAVDGRSLMAQGRLRRLRIHIGSGNVLMEPEERNLCIVQGAAGPDAPQPFEGDAMLSLIPSKALLLLDDDRIEDPTIVRQIADAA